MWIGFLMDDEFDSRQKRGERPRLEARGAVFCGFFFWFFYLRGATSAPTGQANVELFHREAAGFD